MPRKAKNPKPDTPPARTPKEALRNIELLMGARNAGWDRTAVRDIIAVMYGSTEEFVTQHRGRLEEMQRAARPPAVPIDKPLFE